MRYIAILAVGLLPAPVLSPALAQDNEAEKLFRAMEKKLLAAKAFEVAFDYQLGKQKATGELLMSQDSKVRLKVVGHFEEEPKASFELVSDGMQIKTKGAKFFVGSNGMPAVEAGGHSEWKTPKKFHTVLGNTLSRGCVWYVVFAMPYIAAGDWETLPDRDRSRMRVYDFKLTATEKVDAMETKVVRYRVGDGSERFDPEVTVWINAKTQLPVKRSFTLKIEDARIVEHYREFSLDPKIDAKAFELPK
jgi:outer membrane lipoprotein-sorting protein